MILVNAFSLEYHKFLETVQPPLIIFVAYALVTQAGHVDLWYSHLCSGQFKLGTLGVVQKRDDIL